MSKSFSLAFIFIITAACAFPPSLFAARASRQLTDSEIAYLVDLMSDRRYDRQYLSRVFADKRIGYIQGIVGQNVRYREYAPNYKRFLKPVSLGMAKRFSRTWRTCLGMAGSRSGVAAEVITAILLVETSLGNYLGSVPVVSVFTSILLDARSPESSDTVYRQRLEQKAAWAVDEVAALLTMHHDLQIDIFALKGSYAGAFGIPQFLPSSYLQWADSAGESSPVDLFHVPDAIFSVGRYLKEHGWSPALSDKEKKRVLWSYNRSRAYVDTVMQVAELIRTQHCADVARHTPKSHPVL